MEKIKVKIEDERYSTLLLNYPNKNTGNFKNKLFILAHGSSNDIHHPLLKGIAEKFSSNGAVVARFNFLFKEEGKISRNIKEENKRTWITIFKYLSEKFEDFEIIAGGKSLGSRVAANLIISGDIKPDRFISFGYPMHSKTFFGKTNHRELIDIDLPSLVFIGENDPLCRLDIFRDFHKEMKAVDYFIVKNGDHGLSDSGLYNDDLFLFLYEKSMDWIV